MQGSNNAGEIYLFGPSDDIDVVISGQQGSAKGYVNILDQNGSVAASMSVNDVGIGTVEADFFVNVVSHPNKSNLEIVYPSIVGPEAISLVRGTSKLVNGEAVVDVPDHYRAINDMTSMTVVLTPLSADTYGLAVVEKTTTGFRVKELAKGKGQFKFDWEVKCTLKGKDSMKTVREKSDFQVSSTRRANNHPILSSLDN